MKKRLLAVYVASSLAGIGGISSAALTSANGPPRTGGIWMDGGSGRRKRGTGHRRSPADRIAERAKLRPACPWAKMNSLCTKQLRSTRRRALSPVRRQAVPLCYGLRVRGRQTEGQHRSGGGIVRLKRS